MLTQEYKIPDIEAASRYFIDKLKEKGYKVFSVLDVNNKRHKLIYCEEGHWFYLMFKRDKLLKWMHLFPKLKKQKNIIKFVDSINIPLFYNIVDRYTEKKNIDLTMAIVYEDRTIVTKKPHEWLDIANKFILFRKVAKPDLNKKPNYTGKLETIEENTMSCYFTKGDVWN